VRFYSERIEASVRILKLVKKSFQFACGVEWRRKEGCSYSAGEYHSRAKVSIRVIG